MNFNFLKPGSIIYRITEWIFRLIYVNLLWILFSVLGLIIFGIMPSTTALYTIVLKWFQGKTNIEVFNTFKKEYKSKFIRSNIMGLIMLIAGSLLYINFVFYQQSSTSLFQLFFYLTLILSLVYFTMWIYLFPLLVNYDLKIFSLLKNALLVPLFSPVNSAILILVMTFSGILFSFFIFLIPIFGFSSLAFINIWGTSRTFTAVEEKKAIYKNENKQQ